ncbi:MAG: TldD/PmbA family protein [Acidobacteria bacterium]|nr:TldD/PmbA family protein [Acidobacteriota bacterium]
MKELTDIALNAADSGGATYADIRISRHRSQDIWTREERVQWVENSESYGFGVRVLVDGTWGFAASHRVTAENVADVTRRAMAIARANKTVLRKRVELPPVQKQIDHWQSPIEKDPFKIPIERKIDLLLRVNAEALKVKGAKFCMSSMRFLNEEKFFASTAGSLLEQNIYRSWPSFTVTALDESGAEFETRTVDVPPMGLGYEFVERADLIGLASKMAEEAVQKLTAKSVEPGKKDIVLHPTNLWLTIHESVGHPTELDRALGYEANYAGTSFLTTDKLGKLKLGSPIVNIKADKTIRSGLASCGYDDDGVKTSEWHLVKDGVFVDYQTTLEQVSWPEYQAARKAGGLPPADRSYGCSYADSWASVPFQRMPNIHLEPGKKPLTLEQLIADTDDGIYIVGDGSWSIDQQRYNFQFGGQAFFEIKKGKITGMLRDVAYQANSQEFWNACDAICDERSWEMGGSFYDGKGEPGQINAVSHGCSPARFRKVNILNTGKNA